MTQKLITKLINKKAEENNTIDLNAYALGLEDALKIIETDNILDVLNKVLMHDPCHYSDSWHKITVEVKEYLNKLKK